MKVGIQNKHNWDNKWNDIFDQYQQDLRHSYYINALLNEKDKKVLEIGAGSFRDMANLNNLGVNCWGTDFSDTAVNLAKRKFPSLESKIFCSDAFNMNMITDKEFDVTFHNGLWVLFENDTDIYELIKEQVRITKRAIIATVHNAHNVDFVSYFEHLSKKDDLYKIRFFTIDEMNSLFNGICHTVEIIPVGKGKKYYEDKMINEGNFSRKVLKSFFDEVKLNHLNNSERLLCIGHL